MTQPITPNPEEAVVVTEEAVAPTDTPTEETGTEQTETVTTEPATPEGEVVDYKQKFIDSARGAQELLDKNKELTRQIENPEPPVSTDLPTHQPESNPSLYPGFENLDKEAQENLTAYTDAVTGRARDEILKDPSIAFARESYNESRWNTAFDATILAYPDLAEAKEDFRSKYFHPSNVPENIGDILNDLAKIYLFDKARDIGAEEAKVASERVQLEDPTGGDRTPTVSRSLADWQAMQQKNPAEFAKHKAEYDADVASGKLKE